MLNIAAEDRACTRAATRDRHEQAFLSWRGVYVSRMAGSREHRVEWAPAHSLRLECYASGGSWRQLRCVVCGKYFQETLGTIFYGSSMPATGVIRAVLALCEGVSPRKVGRIFGVDKDTVLRWLVAASVHAEAVLGYALHQLRNYLHVATSAQSSQSGVLQASGLIDTRYKECYNC